jgi:2-polyprenyl-3-methyl-5-hydroxy-6-metoxy-1,4-benzoquinol methylase
MTMHNDQARTQWDSKAEFWDHMHGDEGNTFHRYLVGPAAEKLLNVQPGEKILDIGCGNGNFSRRLAELDAEVVASDFSAELIERAKARSQNLPITYHVVDATDEPALLSLGVGQFDAAVCNMAIMDIADIHPMFRAVHQLLKPSGRFVFTLQHPCFNNEAMTMMAEQVPQNGELLEFVSVKLTDYLHIDARLSAGAPGEPNAHYVFHRTLTELLTTAFSAGFVMDGIEETAFSEDLKSNNLLSWLNFHHIPAVFAARLRV